MIDLEYPKNRIISIAERLARRSSMIAAFDYTSHLISTSPFWKYDYLLEALRFLGRTQPLAEAIYEKFKLNFVQI